MLADRRLRLLGIAVVVIGVLLVGAFVGRRALRANAPTAAEKPPVTLPPLPADATPDSGTGPRGTTAGAEIVRLRPEVVRTLPHDPGSYTQGLLVDERGRLFESAGNYGESDVREVDPATGEVLRRQDNDAEQFAEGLTLVGDRLIQLTWREHVANVWERETFAPVGTFAYDTEGWGLCTDGDRLVMSDGTPTLRFRDPATFAEQDAVQVTRAGRPLDDLNELECVDGLVWANVYRTDTIVAIDPDTGKVVREVDATGLLPADQRKGADVLNGIAWKPDTQTFLITGKHWPSMFEVRFTPT